MSAIIFLAPAFLNTDIPRLLSSLGMDFAKTVVQVTRDVVPRSAIRGFRDDYYHLDADVVVLAGETHVSKPVSRPSHSRMVHTN